MSPASAESDLPRIAVLAKFSPEGRHGGAVILRDMLAEYPARNLKWFSLEYSEATWRPEVPRVSFGPVLKGEKRKVPGYSRLAESINVRASSIRCARAVNAFSPDIVWCVLDHGFLPHAERILAVTDVPVHVSVHDHPPTVAELLGDNAASENVERALRTCILRAQSIDVISARMAQLYSSRYGCSPIIVTRGCRMSKGESNVGLGLASKRIIMGGAYGPDMRGLDCVLEACRRASTICADSIEFHAVDERLRNFVGIHVHSWLNEPEYCDLLQTAVAGFAHDPISPAGSSFASLSLPTKVVTYLGAGMPFIYLGPSDSTVADLVNKYCCGIVVDSYSSDEVVNALLAILGPRRNTYVDGASRAAREEFDMAAIRTRLFASLRSTADHRRG